MAPERIPLAPDVELHLRRPLSRSMRVREIEARGGTNLGDGWLRGCEEMATHEQAGRAARCLLILDGQCQPGHHRSGRAGPACGRTQGTGHRDVHLRRGRRPRRAAGGVPVFDCVEFAGLRFRGRFGVLPEALRALLAAAGADWVVGTELLAQFPFVFDLAHGRMKIVQEGVQPFLAAL
jgi:hypothetical protein